MSGTSQSQGSRLRDDAALCIFALSPFFEPLIKLDVELCACVRFSRLGISTPNPGTRKTPMASTASRGNESPGRILATQRHKGI